MSARRFIPKLSWRDLPEPDETEADLTEDEIETNRADREERASEEYEDMLDLMRGVTI